MFKLTRGSVVRIVDTEQKAKDLEGKGFRIITEEEQAEIAKQNTEKQAEPVTANTSAAELKAKDEEIVKLEAENTKQGEEIKVKDEEIKSLKLNTLGMQKEAKQGAITDLEAEKADEKTTDARKKAIDKELETLKKEVEAIDEEIKSLNQ